MKSELRRRPHTAPPVIDVWHAGELVATITDWDGPGIMITTPASLLVETVDDQASGQRSIIVSVSPRDAR